jgi:hypothetical protein
MSRIATVGGGVGAGVAREKKDAIVRRVKLQGPPPRLVGQTERLQKEKCRA